jgi:CheY-like chemotaxis protein
MTHEYPVVLLVEDDAAHAEIARRTMLDTSVNSRVIHVPDGQAALDYLYRQGTYAAPGAAPRPALILLDLRLPGVDGLEVLRMVKSDADLASIPVVVLTSSNSKEDKERAYTHHANGYLVKPLDLIRFVNLLELHGDYWHSWNRNALAAG